MRQMQDHRKEFLSTPSARRATTAQMIDPELVQFLSTPSARRATLRQAFQVQKYYISIHALREEGDCRRFRIHWCSQPFLSTPSARRATYLPPSSLMHCAISIHALREEGDMLCRSANSATLNFYPRPPRGGRQIFARQNNLRVVFLSTPSARRATHFCFGGPHCVVISIHALREEGDQGRQQKGLRVADFYPRPPRGGRPSTAPSASSW